MGKCLDCGEEALDGEEYCEACLLLRDLGLNDSEENHDEMFDDLEGLLPSDDPELSLDNENFASDSNPDEELLGFLDNNTEEENIGISDEDIFSLLETPSEEDTVVHENAPHVEALDDNGLLSDEDIFSLLENVAPEQESVPAGEADEDIFALDDNSMDEQNDIAENGDSITKSSDMGDILSDALGVLNDPAMEEMEKQIMDLMPESEQNKEPEAKGKSKKSKKTENAEKSEKGWFKRLFENVPGPEPDPNAPTEEELEEKKKAEKEAKKKEKAEKKAEIKAQKEAKKKEANDKKAEMKAIKKKLKEEEEANEPVDTGRINKAGASIVFTLAACLAVFLLIGTRTFTYFNDVISAKDYFKNKQYTKAYQQIAGDDIKKKDKETYQKIFTVMQVNKQYDSYKNYYNMEMYPQSLDSLIKGLQRYDKYKESAIDLNIMDDMNYVRTNIVDSLKDSFNLDEDAVQYLMSMDSHETYNEEIVKLAKAS